MNALEPWILARLAAGVAASALFVHGAWVSLKVLRYFRLGASSEGQLALERQAELAATEARVGAVLQGGALLLSLTAADRLAAQLRGAMCGYGVVHAVGAGPAAIVASAAASLGALVLWRALSLDRAVRSLSLVRPLSALVVVAAGLSVIDLGLTAAWLGGLDFSVVASCCSSGLDAGEEATRVGHGEAGRSLALVAAPLLGLALTALSAWAARLAARGAAVSMSDAARGAVDAGRRLALVVGGLTAAALPAAVAAVILVVAPHVYEVPHHRCPYCLFRADALWVGYPLFGLLLLAASTTLGAALAAALLPRDEGDVFARVAPPLLRTGAGAWGAALVLGAAPVVRYLILSGGVPLSR